MSKSVVMAARTDGPSGISGNAGTYFLNLCGPLFQTGTEENAEIPFRYATTLNKVGIRIQANTITATSTFTLRKNRGDTAISISVTADAVGYFEETGTDVTYGTTDEGCMKLVTGSDAPGTMVVTIIKVENAPDDTSKTITPLVSAGSTNVNWASATRFAPVSGVLGADATETNQEFYLAVPGTTEDLYINVLSNPRTTDVTFTSRKNNAAGAKSITVTPSAVGIFEITGSSDSYSPGDLISFGITTGTGTETMLLFMMATNFISTDGKFPMIASLTTGVNISAATANVYNPPAGRLTVNGAESRSSWHPHFDFYAFELGTYISANAMSSGTVTFRSRDNLANGTQTQTISVGTTGFIHDTTHADLISSGTDEYDYNWNGLGAGTVTYRYAISWGSHSDPYAVAGTTPLRMLMGVGT